MTVLFWHHITESVVLPSDEGLGSSAKHYGSGSLGSGSAGSVYLSDSQDWVVSPSCSPDEGPVQHNAISPMLAEETFRYMSKYYIHFWKEKKKLTGVRLLSLLLLISASLLWLAKCGIRKLLGQSSFRVSFYVQWMTQCVWEKERGEREREVDD